MKYKLSKINKFEDVKNGVVFHKIFGNDMERVSIISLLNAVLKLEGELEIVEVSFVHPYELARIYGEKATVLDVSAKDTTGSEFLIEIQVANVDGFDKRVQYYTSPNYPMVNNKDDDYDLLEPDYFIGILDFNYFEGEDYLTHHIIVNDKIQANKLKDIQFIFIELNKFHLKENELKTPIEKWVYFFKNVQKLTEIPDYIEDKGLKKAYLAADLHNWTKEEWREYDNAAIARQDAIGRIEAAEKKGLIISEKKGSIRGEKKKERAVIKQCLEENISIEVISRIVNLPMEEVEKFILKIQNDI